MTKLYRNRERKKASALGRKPFVPEYRRLNKLPIIMETIPRVTGESHFAQGSEYEEVVPRIPLRSHESRVEVVDMFNNVAMDGKVIIEDDEESSFVTEDYEDYDDASHDVASEHAGHYTSISEHAEAIISEHAEANNNRVGEVTTTLDKFKNNLINKGDNFILLIKNSVVMSGTEEAIQSKLTDIVYGDDPEWKSKDVEPDDIVVLKRMKITFGVSIG